MTTPSGHTSSLDGARMAYDVFISHKWDERYDKHVEQLYAQLTSLYGLNVFLDSTKGKLFAGITREIETALHNSRLIVIWHSRAYDASTACRAELVSALGLILQSRHAHERLAIVQPDDEPRPLLSILKDLKASTFVTTDPNNSIGDLSRKLRSHLDSNVSKSTISRDARERSSHWYPTQRAVRLTQLTRWSHLLDILARVCETEFSQVSAPSPKPDVTCLVGFSGLGKTALAQDFATRFANVFQGGIFWIGLKSSSLDKQQRYDELTKQLAEIGRLVIKAKLQRKMDFHSRNAVASALRQCLAKQQGKVLLIVDNWPLDAGLDELNDLLTAFPSERLRVLLTTQNRTLEMIGKIIKVSHFSPAESKELLVKMRTPLNADDELCCNGIATRLGGHPTALQVVGSALTFEATKQAFCTWKTRIDVAGATAITAAQEFDPDAQSNTGGVIQALSAVFDTLTEDERALLRVASWLADAPFTQRLLQVPLWGMEYDNPFIGMKVNVNEGSTRASLGVASLSRRSILTNQGNEQGLWELHQLIARVFRETDSDKRAAMGCRDNLTNLLAHVLRQTDDNPFIQVDMAVGHAYAVAATSSGVPSSFLLHSLGDYYGQRRKFGLQAECYKLALAETQWILGESITQYALMVAYTRCSIQRREYALAATLARRVISLLNFHEDTIGEDFWSQKRREVGLDLSYALAVTASSAKESASLAIAALRKLKRRENARSIEVEWAMRCFVRALVALDRGHDAVFVSKQYVGMLNAAFGQIDVLVNGVKFLIDASVDLFESPGFRTAAETACDLAKHISPHHQVLMSRYIPELVNFVSKTFGGESDESIDAMRSHFADVLARFGTSYVNPWARSQ